MISVPLKPGFLPHLVEFNSVNTGKTALFLVKPEQHLMIKQKNMQKSENMPFTGYNTVPRLLSLLCLHKIKRLYVA